MDDARASQNIEAIKSLKARYFRLLDTKQWDEWKLLFDEDLEFEAPDDRPGVVDHGRDSFVAGVRAIIESAKTIHHGHMPEITLLSDNSARGIWAMEDLLWWPEAAVQQGQPRHLHGFGHYHETYALSLHGWRIKTMRLTRLHLEYQ